ASAAGTPTARITTQSMARRMSVMPLTQRGRYADREDHNGMGIWINAGGTGTSAAGTPTTRITTATVARRGGATRPPARPVRRPRGSQLHQRRQSPAGPLTSAAGTPTARITTPFGPWYTANVPATQRGRYADREDHNELNV